MNKQRGYSTSEVAEITGLSLRQLQWWDERKIAQPTKKQGWRRTYDAADLLLINVVRDLRNKHMSLAKVAKRLPLITKALADPKREQYLIVSTLHLVAGTMGDPREIVALMDGAPEALMLIDLGNHIKAGTR